MVISCYNPATQFKASPAKKLARQSPVSATKPGWITPVTPAVWEVVSGRKAVQGRPRQKISNAKRRKRA
jgi:hypothetical protein